MAPGVSPEQNGPRLTRWLRSLTLLILSGLSVGLCVWALSHRDLQEPLLLRNELGEELRRGQMLLAAVGGVGFGLAGLVTAWLWKLVALERAATRMCPLIVSALLPGLFQYELWLGRDVAFLSGVLVCAASVGVLSRRAIREGLYRAPAWLLPGWRQRCSNWIRRRSRGLGVCLAVAAALAYALYFSVSTINNHQNFGTSAFDLGIETNLVWNAIHFGPLFRSSPLGGGMMHGGHHQTYFAYLIGPIYALVPRAETLLVVQSSFLGAAVIPLFLLARRRLGSAMALILSLCFVLYAPLHGANLYDFHYQPFGVFFILLLAYLMESGRSFKAIFPILLVTLSVREDIGAMAGALGGYFLFSGKRPGAGLAMALIGSTYFVAQKLYVMPELFLNGQSSFAFMYQLLLPAGEPGFGGVIKTALGNPLFTLHTIMDQAKLVYVAQLFVPLALLPLRRSAALLLLLPGFVFTLLSTQYQALIMTSFQYTAYWTPMAFLALVYALEALRQREEAPAGALHAAPPWSRPSHPLASSWLLAVGVASVLTSLRYGAIFQVELARGAFDPVHLRETQESRQNLADFKALASQIPADAKVAASEWLISHLANRRDAYALRNGILDADYILFWLHPTKFRHDERPVLLDALFKHRRYGIVERRGMFVLAKAGHEPTKRVDPFLRREINHAGRGLPPLTKSDAPPRGGPTKKPGKRGD